MAVLMAVCFMPSSVMADNGTAKDTAAASQSTAKDTAAASQSTAKNSQSTAKAAGKTAKTEYEGQICFLEVSGSSDVAVTWSGKTAAILAVQVYDNAGQILINQKNISVAGSTAAVTTNVSFDALPTEGYILKAYLQDKSGKAVSETYVSNRYTKEIQTLLKKTAEDYTDCGDRLIRLTGSRLNNEYLDNHLNDGSFIVLKQSTILLEEKSGGLNITRKSDASDGGKSFELTGIDESMKSKLSNLDLSDDTDDYVFIIDGSDYYAFKVENVDVNNTKVMLYGSSDKPNVREYTDDGSITFPTIRFSNGVDVPVTTNGRLTGCNVIRHMLQK